MPSLGNFDPSWQAAPSSMDFRNKTDAQLCAMAKNAGSHFSVAKDHLREDKLVLWAVGDGRLPFNHSATTAPPHNASTWRTYIQQWADAGYPCP